MSSWQRLPWKYYQQPIKIEVKVRNRTIKIKFKIKIKIKIKVGKSSWYLRKEERKPLVSHLFIYHRHLTHLGKLIQKNTKYLYVDGKVRSVFAPSPFASLRFARNLRSHLVRSKLYPFERKTGSRKCKFPRCLICKNVEECDTFSSYVIKSVL